ncbi:hypothetical protein ABLN67_05795, partial [Mycobacterium tuberculosis]
AGSALSSMQVLPFRPSEMEFRILSRVESFAFFVRRYTRAMAQLVSDRCRDRGINSNQPP